MLFSDVLNVRFGSESERKRNRSCDVYFKIRKESSAAYMLDDMIYLNNGVYSLIGRINREFQILLNDGDYFSLFHIFRIYIQGEMLSLPLFILGLNSLSAPSDWRCPPDDSRR